MKIKTLLALLAVIAGACSLNAQTQYSMEWPMPIEKMDENVTLGQNKFGYYNLDKTDGSFVLVIGYRFENAYPFNSNTGLARVVSGGKYGYIDVGGMMKIKPVYDEAEDFDEFSHARVCINGKYGVIDKNGTLTVPIVYDSMSPMFDGWYEVNQGDKWGYVSNNGIYASSYSEYEQKKAKALQNQ